MVSLNIDLSYQFLLTFLIQFFVLVVSLFVATRLINNITELSYKKGLYQGNLAISVSIFGYYSSIILILISALRNNFYEDILLYFGTISSIATIGVILLTVERKIFNYLFLTGVNSQFELERENLALAVLQTGSGISIAILVYYIFENTNFVFQDIMNGIILIISSYIILFVIIKIAFFNSRFDEVREIQKGNIAVAIELASIFIAISLLIGNISGDIKNINAETFSNLILLSTISFLPLIYLPSVLTSFIVSENKKADSSIEDGNIVIAIKSSVVRISISILLIKTLPHNIFIFH